MMSQWLGLSSSSDSPSSSDKSSHVRPLCIAKSNSNTTATDLSKSSNVASSQSLPRTKSDEVLFDFDAMRFLAAVDARLKVDRAPLPQEDVDRLEALYAQACADDCQPLLDIVEHFETEFRRLRNAFGAGASASTLPPAARC